MVRRVLLCHPFARLAGRGGQVAGPGGASANGHLPLGRMSNACEPGTVKLLCTEWVRDWRGSAVQTIAPTAIDLADPRFVTWLAGMLGNGEFDEVCFEGDCPEAIAYVEAMLQGTGSAASAQADPAVSAARLFRSGYRIFVQAQRAVFFVNPCARPELFATDDLSAYAAEFDQEAVRALHAVDPVRPASVEPGAPDLSALAFGGIALLLIFFFLAIGLPPNPLSERYQDWWMARFGAIDTMDMVWATALISLCVELPLLIGALWLAGRLATVFGAQAGADAAVRAVGGANGTARARTAAVSPSDARREAARDPAPTGFRPLRRVSAWIVGVSVAVWAVLALVDAHDADSEPVAPLSYSGHEVLEQAPRHVDLHATALRDLRSTIHEKTTGAAQLTRTRTTFSGIGKDFGPNDNDVWIVPLAGPDWRPDRPIQLFCRCTGMLAPTRFENGAIMPRDRREDVSLRGTLHRDALPLFAVNAYRRAGFAVAEPYYVLEREVSADEKVFRRRAVLVVGLLLAVAFEVILFMAARKERKRLRRG